MASLYLYDEILAGAPENLCVGDGQHVLVVGVTGERVAAGWVHGEQLGPLGIELHALERADVYLREITLVEVGLQHFAIHQYALLAQFFLGAEDIPSGVELCVLSADGLVFLCIVLLKI